MDQTIDFLTAALLPDLGSRKLEQLCRRAPLSQVLYEPDEHADLLSVAARGRLASGAARRAAEEEQRAAFRLGFQIISRREAAYPALLKEIYDPPAVLYVWGRLDAAELGGVAIVGSRAASPQGRTLARCLGRDLAALGLTVVSGLARGIDTASHEGALDARGRTVAILGSGLDRLYPPENARLAAAIAERGAVVSEFPLGTAPHAFNFPRRNRVIAGWARALVVVEAAERSGALGTARQALDFGREVLAVPGHPSQSQSQGTNALIRDGAVLVRHAGDVAQELGLLTDPVVRTAGPEDVVLAAIPPTAPVSVDEIQAQTGEQTDALLARLGQLELQARVRRLPGALYVRS